MKAKLIKREDNFYSLKVDGIVMATSNGMLVDYKLSKQNCDEIFGVVDVEKLADDYFKSTNENSVLWRRIDYKAGFNKAMELNKDKLFTLEDMRVAYNDGMANVDSDGDCIDRPDDDFLDTITTLQQPTEIEVEIEMSNIYVVPEPLIDSENCLILKKI